MTLVFNVMFVFMHKWNYPEVSAEDAMTVNLVMICGINLPWTASCMRQYLVIPDTSPAR